MSLTQILLAICCVIAISTGQLLFRSTGLALAEHGSWFNLKVLTFLGIAGIIYVAATILWVYLLKETSLSKAYFFMALSFILVPIGSALVFNETLSSGQYIGGAFIVTGIIVLARFG